MKTCDEKIQTVFKRIKEEKTARENRKRKAIKIATPILSLCVAACIGYGVWRAGVTDINRKTDNTVDTGNSSITYDTSANTGEASERDTGNDNINEEISTSGENNSLINPSTSDSVSYFLWNGLKTGGRLYNALKDDPSAVSDIYAVYHPATAEINSFSFDGKTLAELAVEAYDERIMPEKMISLLKLGDELKYGTALYETGAPSGVKWDKALYEDTVAYIGDELIGTYIVDGIFMRDELQKAIDEYNETSATEKYDEAYSAYLDMVLSSSVELLTENNIVCKRDDSVKYGIVISMAPEGLINLPLDDICDWSFMLKEDYYCNVSDGVTVCADMGSAEN